MAQANEAAVLHGVNDLRVEPWPLADTLQPGSVRVAIKAVGICGSDVHYLRHGRIGDFVVKAPMVIGHESAGVVTEVAPGVTGLAVGDRVALEPGVPCFDCRASREGRYNLDQEIKFFATPPFHGSLARYVDHPAAWCYKLPDTVSLEEGAFCEPLSVGVHACRRAGVQPGKDVAILGAGPIGLVTLLAAKAFGADKVIITDVKQENLDLAQRYGATPVLISASESPESVSSRIKAALASAVAGAESTAAPSAPATATAANAGGGGAGGTARGPDIVIDCAGFQSTLQTGIHCVEAGGSVVLVGMGAEHITVPAAMLTVKELDLKGSFRYANTYPLCITLMASKRVDIAPLITHRFGFSASEVASGFDTAARAQTTGAIKIMFNLEHA